MENFWNTVGTGLLGGIGGQISYGLGELTGYNNKLKKDQLEQQQGLTNMQYSANYNLMKSSYEEQQKMWDSTNYEAQIKHLQNAGLNPALMYAKGGAGGTTGSGGTSVNGGQAATTAATQSAHTQNAMQGMAMMKLQSEIKVNEATANKLNADATKTGGIDTELGKTEVSLKTAQTEFQKIQTEISAATKETVINTAIQSLKNLTAIYDNILSGTSKNQAETETINKSREAQISEILANVLLKKAETAQSKQAVEKMKAEIDVMWPTLEATLAKIPIEQQNADTMQKRLEWEIEQVLPWNKQSFTISQGRELITSIAQAILAMYLFKGRGTPAPIKGFK